MQIVCIIIMRTNIYKKKILKILENNHLLSIADIHQKISNANYSTVYRNIEQLVAEEQIRKVVFDKGVVMYEIYHDEHTHDHFLCTDCGDIKEVNIPVTGLSLLLENYKIKDLLIRGLCKKCNQEV